MTNAGRPSSAMRLAMVKVLPDPVTPSRVWKRSPRRTPSTSLAIASGWSPCGRVVGLEGELVHPTSPLVAPVLNACGSWLRYTDSNLITRWTNPRVSGKGMSSTVRTASAPAAARP